MLAIHELNYSFTYDHNYIFKYKLKSVTDSLVQISLLYVISALFSKYVFN